MTIASSTKIVTTLDDQVWRQYVQQHPQGNIFHTPEMLAVLGRVKGHRSTLQAAVNEQGQVLALLPSVSVTLMNGVLRRPTTRAIAYGGVLCNPGPDGAAALADLLKAHNKAIRSQALFTEIRNLTDVTAIQPILRQRGYHFEEHLDYLINLDRPLEEIMNSIGARTRKHIRQGLRKGEVVVEQVTDPSQVKVCYDLIQKSYLAANIPLADGSLFKATFDILVPQGQAQFWLARAGNAYVAASVELPYKNVLYGWYSGIDRQYANLSPGELLMWQVLKWGAENGYKVYDFGGAGKPTEKYSVRDFKSKFGGDLVCFGRNTCVHAPALMRLSQVGYSIYRRLRLWKG